MKLFVKGLVLLCVMSHTIVSFSQKLKRAEVNALSEKVAASNVNDTLKAVALAQLIANSRDNPTLSADYTNQFYALVQRMDNPKAFGAYFAYQSDLKNIDGNYNDAVTYARVGVLILQKYGTAEEYLPAVDKLCVSLLATNQIDRVLVISNGTLEEYQNFPNGKYKAGIFSKRGSGYLKKKQYKKAIADFEKALEGYRKDSFTNGEFFTYNQIATCYIEMNALKDAQEYVLKVINHPASENMPTTNLALMYDKLAFIYLKMQQYNRALDYFNIALANCSYKNVNMIKQIKANRAMAYYFLHRMDEALTDAEEVIGNGEKMNTYRKRDAYYVAGLYYFDKNDFTMAKDRFKIAIKAAIRIDSSGNASNHNFDVLSDAKKKLSLIELKSNDPEKSYSLLEESYEEQQKKLAAAKDEQLHKVVNTFELKEKKREVRQLTREQLKNKLEIKEQQNKLILLIGSLVVALVVAGFTYRGYCIKKRNAREQEQKRKTIERQNERLEAAFKERGVLLKEIHHRVKNNFQMVISLLQIQADEGGYSNVEAFMEEAVSRILSMSLIHQNLYQSDNLSEVDFSEYISELVTYTENAFAGEGKVVFKTAIPNVMVDLQLAVPLGLILNEMILNSLKHVKGVGGTIKISISLEQEQEGSYLLCYDDNGKKETAGNTNSFGIELIALLVRQIEGELLPAAAKNVSYRIRFNIT